MPSSQSPDFTCSIDLQSCQLYLGDPSTIIAYLALIANVTGFSIVPPFVFPELVNPLRLCHPSLVYAQTILSVKSAHVYLISVI